MFLLVDGNVARAWERRDIEGREPAALAAELVEAFRALAGQRQQA